VDLSNVVGRLGSAFADMTRQMRDFRKALVYQMPIARRSPIFKVCIVYTIAMHLTENVVSCKANASPGKKTWLWRCDITNVRALFPIIEASFWYMFEITVFCIAWVVTRTGVSV